MAPTNSSAPVAETEALTTSTDRTPEVITTPDEFSAAMKRWEGRFNVLSPFTNLSGLAAQHGIFVSTVRLSTDTSPHGPGHVYGDLPFLKGAKGSPSEELAIAKLGLRRLAECGGISTTTTRTDPRTIPHYWEIKAIASYRGVDGSIITREADAEWDLRSGSDRLKGWTANQISEGRKNGLRNCQARAINAAIRECGCGIKQKYTRAELEKPFLVLRVAFQPDLSDPEQRRLVTENSLRGTSMLYPQHAALPATPSDDYVEAEPVTSEPRLVGTNRDAAPAQTEPDPNVPPVEGAVRIERVDTKTGKSAKTGRPWTRYVIVDSNGVEHTTFDTSLAKHAESLIATRAWVEISEETSDDGKYRNLIEISPAGAQPSLLPNQEDL